MKVIRVQYTIKEDFIDKNKENISRVMEELRSMNNPNIKYFSSQHEDKKSFMHVVIYKNTEAESLPSSLDSFKSFQAELKENLEVPPQAETFEIFDSSYEIFDNNA